MVFCEVLKATMFSTMAGKDGFMKTFTVERYGPMTLDLTNAIILLLYPLMLHLSWNIHRKPTKVRNQLWTVIVP